MFESSNWLNNIDTILFDLDGTLADSMKVWSDVDRLFFTRRNLEVPIGLSKDIEGLSIEETADLHITKYGINNTKEEIMNEWLNLAFEQYQKHIQLKNGARELLEKLKKQGIKMAICSSCPRDLLDVFLKENAKIDHFFHAIVSSSDVAKGKPNPDVFLKGLELCEANAETTIVFEDTVSGAIAAKRAGIQCICVEDEHNINDRENLTDLCIAIIPDFASL
eukprot:TRINITY_DN2873_c0_g5_i1.p1 TRINITY_DN2873_c0_g5~~TRINITY_DN2873_c0_g5_i1.p1  ORF type:complete len:233 (+),score=77.77 TRINITY_DN2873_c0_g5_i1:37-699(+)